VLFLRREVPSIAGASLGENVSFHESIDFLLHGSWGESGKAHEFSQVELSRWIKMGASQDRLSRFGSEEEARKHGCMVITYDCMSMAYFPLRSVAASATDRSHSIPLDVEGCWLPVSQPVNLPLSQRTDAKKRPESLSPPGLLRSELALRSHN
jgi:hypothetical protein